MSRVSRFAIAFAFASGLGIGAAHAVAAFNPLDDGLNHNLNLTGNFDPAPLGIFPAGELDFTAGGSGSALEYFTSGVQGGLQITHDSTPFTIQFRYMGAEAGNVNASFSGLQLFASDDGTLVEGVSSAVRPFNPPALGASPAYFPFRFETNGTFNCAGGQGADNGGTLAGGNIDGGCSGTLAIAFRVVNAGLAYAFFQDGDGDFDFDDMVVRMQIIVPTSTTGEIPVPPAAILFGSALAGMGLLGVRRRRSRQG